MPNSLMYIPDVSTLEAAMRAVMERMKSLSLTARSYTKDSDSEFTIVTAGVTTKHYPAKPTHYKYSYFENYARLMDVIIKDK